MKNRLIIAAVAFGALAGCTKESSSVEASGDSAVQFTSATIATRTVDDDSWESDDRIGISTYGMLNGAEHLNIEYFATTGSNSKTTTFDAVDAANTIFYPNGQEDAITFYAYYPYSNEDEYSKYTTVDISGQHGDLGSVDFMTAPRTWFYGADNNETEIAFGFYHKLSKLVFNLTFNDEAQIKESGNTISATISNVVKSKAYHILSEDLGKEYDDGIVDELTSFALNASIEDPTDASDATATITAILHPSTVDAEVVATINGTDYTFGITKSLESGKLYTYNVNVGRAEAVVGQSTINEWDSSSPSENVNGDLLTPALNWDGSVATDFNGVAFDPDSDITEYKISSGSELALLSELVKAGNLMEGITFTMTGNFTLSDREWIPIKYNNSSYFLGTLDGGGYAITGLNINYESSGCGLFAYIGKGSTIKNLTVKGSMVVYSKLYTGAIAGYSFFGTVENCNSDVTITTVGEPTYTGGLVGINNSGTITGCCNRGDVAGYTGVGGIVGYNFDGTITGCYNRGEINGNSIVGGVIGNTDSHSTDKSTVIQSFNTGTVKGEEYVGGVVGKNNDYGIIQSVYNTGEVSGTSYVGGVTSYNGSYTTTTIAYNTAEVSGTEYVGGVIGYNIYSSTYLFSYYNEEKGEGTNSIYGYNSNSNTSGAIFSDPDADITIGSYSEPLVDLLNRTLTSAVWESDIESVNGGFPILTSINY